MSKNRRSVSEYLTRTEQTMMTPQGMGDLLPPYAAQRRELARRLLRHFALAGYDLVTPPLFEHASVVEEGNESVDRRDMLRFVEPESGEVAVLRPDITPQVARMVATRLSDRPGPYRLCYEGRVLRRRRGRARKHRQLAQVGVECIGIGSPEGDIETIAMAADACDAVGLTDFRVELCTSALVGPLMASIPEEARERVAEIVGSKDAAGLRAIARDMRLPKTPLARLESLLSHYGDLSMLREARKAFRWADATAPLRNLQTIAEGLCDRGLGDRLRVDLSETRGLTYYTGASFQVFAEGPGEPICAGGRYDNLLSRFGNSQPATGFALDLENLQWALRSAGQPFEAGSLRKVVMIGSGGPAARLASTLRNQDVAVASLEEGTSAKEALAFATSWGYAATLIPARGATMHARRTCDGASRALNTTEPASLATFVEWAFANKD